MSPDPHPGEGIHVPCRHCGTMMGTEAAEGATTISCPTCQERTRIKMTKSGGGALKVRTAREEEN